MCDDDVLKVVLTKNNKINHKALNNMSDEMMNYIQERYSDSLSVRETIYRIARHIDVHPLCPICGQPVMIRLKGERFWADTCSSKCAAKLIAKINEENALKKYGVSNTAKLPTIRDKISKKNKEKAVEAAQKRKETNLERYGVANCFQSKEKQEAIKETKRKRYNDENYVNVDKAKRTKLERYGNEKYVNVNGVKQTKLDRYGNENYNNFEKAIQTNLRRYGCKYVLQSPDVLEKISRTVQEKYGVDNTFKSKEIQKRIQHTIRSKNNGLYHTQTPEFRKKMSQHMPLKEVQEKRLATLRKNNTFNTSKPEEYVYRLLCDKFCEEDIIRQYMSDKYPFKCDFYIKSIDTYIEYNGSHYHCSHPYDENNEDDVRMLQILQQKAATSYRHTEGKKSQYDSMIYTWTILDVKKRTTAKQNNLNHVEFWNIQEVEKWLNKE